MWTVVAPDRVRGAGRVEVSDAPHFFPPRLEVVALQQHPDRFPPHVWNDPAFDRFLREQADRPPRRADRRIGARHGEDALLVGGREDFRCHGTRPLIERRLEAVGAVALGDVAHRLRGQLDGGCDARRTLPRSNANTASARKTTRTGCTPPCSRASSVRRLAGTKRNDRGGPDIPQSTAVPILLSILLTNSSCGQRPGGAGHWRADSTAVGFPRRWPTEAASPTKRRISE